MRTGGTTAPFGQVISVASPRAAAPSVIPSRTVGRHRATVGKLASATGRHALKRWWGDLSDGNESGQILLYGTDITGLEVEAPVNVCVEHRHERSMPSPRRRSSRRQLFRCGKD